MAVAVVVVAVVVGWKRDKDRRQKRTKAARVVSFIAV